MSGAASSVMAQMAKANQRTREKMHFGPMAIFVSAFIKFLGNTGLRFVYPFAVFLAPKYGMSLSTFSLVLAMQEASGLVTPIIGPIGDWAGNENLVVAGIILCVIGSAFSIVTFNIAILLVARFIFGMGFNLMTPGIQAVLTFSVPVARVGRITGIVEVRRRRVYYCLNEYDMSRFINTV